MVKLSPMLDLSLALKELQHVQEVHIISANNECKELLLILGQASVEEISIHCVNLPTKGTQEEAFRIHPRTGAVQRMQLYQRTGKLSL